MKIELHRNGSYQLQLHPEDPTEVLWLSEMEQRASKGQAVQIKAQRPADADVWWIICVEEKK